MELIKDFIRLITNNSDSYDEKHMKIKFNSDDALSLKKILEDLFFRGTKPITCKFL